MNMFLSTRITALFAAMLFNLIPVLAQPSSYIITATGDTVLGTMKNLAENSVKFKANGQTRFIKYRPAEVNRFYYAKTNMPYVAASLPGKVKQVYMILEEEGRINALRFFKYRVARTGFGGTMASVESMLFLKKSDDALTLLNTNAIIKKSKSKRKDILADFIADDASLSRELESSTELDDEVILYFVKAYNRNWINKPLDQGQVSGELPQ